MYVAMIRVTNRRILVTNISNLVVLTTQRRHQHTSQEVGGKTLKKPLNRCCMVNLYNDTDATVRYSTLVNSWQYLTE